MSPSPNPTTASPTAPLSTTPTEAQTLTPTVIPTTAPTVLPTNSPTYECEPYGNNINDLIFQGVGSDCRAGLDVSFPGGLTCASPYIVCLPQENSLAFFGDQQYKSSTYRYSVDECLQECSNDQRCLGIEFVADTSSPLGDCNLIDDIPLV